MSLSDGSSDDFDPRTGSSSISSARCSNKEARVLKRLPKRIRLDTKTDIPEASYSASFASLSLDKSRKSTKQPGFGQSDVESTPALDSSDNTSAENEDILPSTPPELHHHAALQSHYQPLFAPVDHIVKQAALGTALFGPAVQHGPAPTEEDQDETVHGRSSTPSLLAQDYPEADEDEEVATFPNSKDSQHSTTPSLDPDFAARSDAVDPTAASNNTKKRKVPNQLVPNDRSLLSDGEQSDDGVEELPLSADHFPSELQDPPLQALTFRRKPSRQPYTSAKLRPIPYHHSPLFRAPTTPALTFLVRDEATDRAATADEDGHAHRKSKKSVKHPRRSSDAAGDHAVDPAPWNEEAAHAEPPTYILHDLYDPERGPLYPPASANKTQECSQRTRGESQESKPAPLPPELTLETFAFRVPLSPILNSRIEDLRNEKERQMLARELALERERLRAKEAELLSLKRRELAAAQAHTAAGEAKREYVTADMQTELDPSATGGKIIYASKWSTSGPPGEPSSDKKKGKVEKGKKAPSKKKKKKRAAHANANNHHHRDNYVPSRQPRSGGAGAAGSGKAAQDAPREPSLLPSLAETPSLGLVPDDNVFSTASFHPQLGYTHLTPFFVGPDEWLCSWCEMALLFGDDDAKVQSLVKKRKNALKVRKKAQRRAAKAAAGELPSKDKKKKSGSKPNGSHGGSQQQQNGGRKYAAVQTVPEGEDPHAAPPPPETGMPAAASQQQDEDEEGEEVEEVEQSDSDEQSVTDSEAGPEDDEAAAGEAS